MAAQVLAGSERLHFGVKTALVTCCFVLFDDAFICHAIDDRNGSAVSFLCWAVLASINGREDLLHLGANERAQACVVRALLIVLLCSFTSLW